MPLPVAYQARLQQTAGVTMATHQTWFGGIYQDPANFFANIAVEPEQFLAIYPEFRVPPDQTKAWLADRQGAIAGRNLADRFGWTVGDRIPIVGTIWQPKQVAYTGSSTSSASTTAMTHRQDQFFSPVRLSRREPRRGRRPGRGMS